MSDSHNISALNDLNAEFSEPFIPTIPEILPMHKMYNIKVGNKDYTVSGASLSSDSPSYFTNYFTKPENENKTLFIDRSPVVFDMILLHLQGYYIDVKTPLEFVYLFSDVFYYNLPRLKEFLYQSDFFVNVGSKSFKFSKKLVFSKGNYPNYFSVTYNALFRDPTSLISNLDLLRPPPQAPIVVQRCTELFELLLNYLRGYEINIKSEELRNKLLRECRYYKFLELEQRIINHSIRTSPFTLEEEITIFLKDIKRKGLSGCDFSNSEAMYRLTDYTNIKYSRPFVDENTSRTLILQIDSSEMFLIVDKSQKTVTTRFMNSTADAFKSVFTQFMDRPEFSSSFKVESQSSVQINSSIEVEAYIDSSSHIRLNGVDMNHELFQNEICDVHPASKVSCLLVKSQWYVQVKNNGFRLSAVKLDGFTNQFEWNKDRSFL